MPQNFISRYNNLLAVKGLGSIEYTAGPNIDISDYVISGRDWTSDIDSAIKGVKGSGFSAATAWVDSQGYLTAHQDVDNLPYVQNSALEFYSVNISGISGSGLYALSAEGAFTAETANFAYNSESAESAGYAESAGTTDSANYALTALFANSATSSLIADTAVYAYTADKADDLTNWTYTDSAMTGIKGYNGTAFISQGLQYWDYTDSAQTAISGYNGTAFLSDDTNCPWISGNKVIGAITADFGNTVQVISSFDFYGNKNHYISLKGFNLTLPSTANIASTLGQKLDISTFNTFIENSFRPSMIEVFGSTADISAFVNTGCVHNSALASTENGLISSISGSGFYVNGGGTQYVPGQYIKISGNVISVTGLQPAGNYVTYYDGYDTQSAGWKTNNSTGEFVAMTTGTTLPYILLSSTGLGSKSACLRIDTAGIHIYSGDPWRTAADITYGKYTAGPNININSSNGISGKDWTKTITAASAYAVSFSANTVASAKTYTDDEISAHIKYVSYGALAGGTVTFADVRSAILDGGIVIPYEVKNPGTNYVVYNYTRSGINNLTTGYDFTRYDAGGNCITLTVSSYNNGATTGCVTGIQKVFATPSDVKAVDRIVLVAASGYIPASGSSDNKVYIVTGY